MLPRFYELPNVTFLRNKRVSLLQLMIRAGPLGQHVLHGVLTPGLASYLVRTDAVIEDYHRDFLSLIFFFPPALPPRPHSSKILEPRRREFRNFESSLRRQSRIDRRGHN